MFMIERGVEIDRVEIDIMAGENLNDEYKKLNPSAQSPCLILDNGMALAESTVICSYLDEISDGDSLIGTTPEERAETRMWSRRIDGKILEPLTLAFRSAEGLPMFESRCRVIPHAADDLKAIVQESWAWLDGLMGDKQYVCGERFTLADVQLYVFADFGNLIGQGIPAELANIQAWFARVGERPSAAATVG
jgi:glutathione S-transferase|tara:strand:+ start:806 stop:1381 length:576 start_codon:yes stop_codon:yes gene_type:complete